MSDNLVAVQKREQLGRVPCPGGDRNPSGWQSRGLDLLGVGGRNKGRVGWVLHPTIIPHVATTPELAQPLGCMPAVMAQAFRRRSSTAATASSTATQASSTPYPCQGPRTTPMTSGDGAAV